MITVDLNGGLGNQICQYIFGRYLELVYGYKDILFNDHWFYLNHQHNGYELEIFKNTKIKFFKHNFDLDVWKHILKLSDNPENLLQLYNVLQDNDIDIHIVSDEHCGTLMKPYVDNGGPHDNFNVLSSSLFHNPECLIHEHIKKIQNICFLGIWIYEPFGQEIKKIIEHELQFPELIHQENLDFRDKILSNDIAVGLHVRRGDFLDCKKEVNVNKYAKVILELKSSLKSSNKPIPSFFIFSDDIPWCRENLNILGFDDTDNIIFIVGNHENSRNYIDMQLMTYCDYLIHDPASSFALAAQLISEKTIIRITAS